MSLHDNISINPFKAFTAPSNAPSMGLREFSTVASYSWANSSGTPTLVVPGDPPKWIEPSMPLRLQPDQGIRYIDHTGDQCDKANVCRLMPLFQSVEHCSPNFDFKSLNLVCNRNNLRNLLRWIEGVPKKDFRIDLHLVNDKKSLVMLEYEVEFVEEVTPVQFRGYGDNFRKKTVHTPMSQTKHNRIVTWKLGQYQVLMGHKVEAHVERADDDKDDIENLMSSLNVQDATDHATRNETVRSGYLPVRRTASRVKEYDFVEIKTMSQRKTVDWEDFYPQIYLSQTKSLFAAFHFRGQFVKIDKYNSESNELAKYKESVEKTMGKLLEFLRRLMGTLNSAGDGPWALVCVNGNMELHNSSEPALPDAILSKF